MPTKITSSHSRNVRYIYSLPAPTQPDDELRALPEAPAMSAPPLLNGMEWYPSKTPQLMTCSRARWNCSVNIGVLFWALRGAAVEQLFELLLERSEERRV